VDGLSKLLTQRASKAAKSGLREVIARSAGLIITGLLFVSAFLFGLLAVFHSFAATHGPVPTAAFMCLGLLVLAVIAWLIAEKKAAHEKHLREAEAQALENGVKAAMSLVGKLGSGGGSNKAKLALPLIGLVAGFLLAGRGEDDD